MSYQRPLLINKKKAVFSLHGPFKGRREAARKTNAPLDALMHALYTKAILNTQHLCLSEPNA